MSDTRRMSRWHRERRSFYVRSGRRRHAPRIFRGSASGGVVFWCGIEGHMGVDLVASSVAPNCHYCLRRTR